MNRVFKRLCLPAALALLLCGCQARSQEPVAFRNETGVTIESIRVDNAPDLLVNGPLQPDSAVQVEYVPTEEPCTLVLMLETGERIQLRDLLLTPGCTVTLDFSDDLSYSIENKAPARPDASVPESAEEVQPSASEESSASSASSPNPSSSGEE